MEETTLHTLHNVQKAFIQDGICREGKDNIVLAPLQLVMPHP